MGGARESSALGGGTCQTFVGLGVEGIKVGIYLGVTESGTRLALEPGKGAASVEEQGIVFDRGAEAYFQMTHSNRLS